MMDFFSNIVQVEDKKVMFVDNNIYGVYRANIGVMMNPKIVDIRFFICSIIMRINMSWRDKGSFFNLKYIFTSFKPLRIKQNIII